VSKNKIKAAAMVKSGMIATPAVAETGPVGSL
jgi:hypothetical protein